MDDQPAPPPEPRPKGDLVIDDERGLIRHRKAIVNRLQAHPEAMRMLIVNPVMAFADAGIRLSPAVGRHVLHAIQYPPEVRAERDRLERELRTALVQAPRPTDPRWLADVVFGRLGVAPLDTTGAAPVYRPSFDAETVARLTALLPTRGVTTVGAPPGAAPQRLSFEPTSVTMLDLDAPVPELPSADTAPPELALVDLWFYKDSAPPIRSLLQLGILTKSGVAIYSASQYRKIRDGQAQGELVQWIRVVNIPSRKK